MKRPVRCRGFRLALLAAAVSAVAARPSVGADRVLLAPDFNAVPTTPWNKLHGTWKAEGGVLRGTEVPADQHTASFKTFVPFRDGTFTYELRFDGATHHRFGVNAPASHLFHVDVRPDSLVIVKDVIDKTGGEKPKVLARKALALEAGKWYPIRAEIAGDTLTFSIGETKLSARHDYIGREKGSFNIYVTGDSLSFRHFRLTTPEPEKKP